MHSIKRKYVSVFIRTLLFAICFGYIFFELNFSQFKIFLLEIEWHSLIPVLMIVFLGYWFLGRRLNSLVSQQGGRAGKTLALKISIIALGINSVFPAKIGELVKLYLIHSKQKLSVPGSLSVVFFERFSDANVLFLLLIFASLQISINLAPFLLVVTILWFFLILVLKFDALFFRLIKYTPDLINNSLQQVHSAVNRAISYENMTSLLFYTLAIWGLYFFQIWIIITLIMNMDLSIAQLLVVFVISAIGMAVPSTPGSFGVYEASMILALSWYDIDKEQAVIGALFCHMVQFVPPVIITLAILFKMPVNFKAVKTILK